MKHILHYGLQRSGTNFLEALLLKNYEITMLNQGDDRKHPLQKHFRLYDNKRLIPEPKYQNNMLFDSFEDYLKRSECKKEIDGVLVISKDPYSWLISYKKWAKKCKWPKPDYHYIDEYNEFYGKWADFAKQDKRIVFVRYIDLLNDADKELKYIETKFDLTVKEEELVKKVKKVNQSKRFSKSKLNYYKNSEYLSKYRREDLTFINSRLDKSLVTFLGYKIQTV